MSTNKFELSIRLDYDDAVLTREDVSSLLKQVADQVKFPDMEGTKHKYQNIRDSNGNIVGSFRFDSQLEEDERENK